jgi:hypothetical protein
MPAAAGFVNFSPDNDIPTLRGKVILVTGGTTSDIVFFNFPTQRFQ